MRLRILINLKLITWSPHHLLPKVMSSQSLIIALKNVDHVFFFVFLLFFFHHFLQDFPFKFFLPCIHPSVQRTAHYCFPSTAHQSLAPHSPSMSILVCHSIPGQRRWSCPGWGRSSNNLEGVTSVGRTQIKRREGGLHKRLKHWLKRSQVLATLVSRCTQPRLQTWQTFTFNGTLMFLNNSL